MSGKLKSKFTRNVIFKVDKLLTTFGNNRNACSSSPARQLLSCRTEENVEYLDDLTNRQINLQFNKDRVSHAENIRRKLLLMNLGENLKINLASKMQKVINPKEYTSPKDSIMRSLQSQRALIDKIVKRRVISGQQGDPNV